MANYCTPAELRTQIEKVGTTGSGSDASLNVIIEAVSRSIDNYTNRPDGFIAVSVATARYYSGRGEPYLMIDECVEITQVAVKDSTSDTTYVTWATTDWQAASGGPKDPDWNSLPYDLLIVLPTGDYSCFIKGAFTKHGIPTVRVTAKWGYAVSVPGSIKQATIAMASRWFKQGQGAWADTLASPELSQLIYRKENVDIRFMLTRFIRPAIGGR